MLKRRQRTIGRNGEIIRTVEITDPWMMLAFLGRLLLTTHIAACMLGLFGGYALWHG